MTVPQYAPNSGAVPAVRRGSHDSYMLREMLIIAAELVVSALIASVLVLSEPEDLPSMRLKSGCTPVIFTLACESVP